MIFFIADTHLGHQRIIEYCNRPFSSVQEMDDTILYNINNKVKVKDTLYILGDFCKRNIDPYEYREKIICEDIHLIMGNHDNFAMSLDAFVSVEQQKEIIYCNQKIFLCHYPMRSWPNKQRKSWNLYGHVHGLYSKEDSASDRLTLDVGVDNKRNGVGFGTPWSFKDVQQNFLLKSKNFSRQPIDSADAMLYNQRNNAR